MLLLDPECLHLVTDDHRLDPFERMIYEQRWTTTVLPADAMHILRLAF